MDNVFYLKNIFCPICNNSFKTTKIRSDKVRVVKIDTDLCRIYEGENPYFYEINVCTNCGFSFSDHFKVDLYNRQIDSFNKVVTKHWEKKDYCGRRNIYQAIETYKLALLSAQIMGLKDSIRSGILLRISWLNRHINNMEEEKRFMKGAVECLKKVYEYEDSKMKEGIAPELAIYLLGELNYRLGNYQEAVNWFNIGISKYSQNSSVNKKTIIMLRDRWMDIRNQSKK